MFTVFSSDDSCSGIFLVKLSPTKSKLQIKVFSPRIFTSQNFKHFRCFLLTFNFLSFNIFTCKLPQYNILAGKLQIFLDLGQIITPACHSVNQLRSICTRYSSIRPMHSNPLPLLVFSTRFLPPALVTSNVSERVVYVSPPME